MRGTPSEPEVSAAIRALRRLHGTQPPPAPGTHRTVWHQGGPQADLLSSEDVQGRVVRQEFTLFQDYFLWTGQHGLRTGQVADEASAAGMKGTPTIAFDRTPDAERLARALSGLRASQSDDPYLLHLKQVLEAAHQALPPSSERGA